MLNQRCRSSLRASLWPTPADVASVLHSRIERWTHAAGGRRRHTGQLIAGLIPRAQGVRDPDMARALAERDQAMEQRALSLAEEAITAGQSWVRPLGAPPSEPAQRERWLREVSTVAAYRDRWHIEGQRPLGAAAVEKTWNKRPNASGHWPPGSGPKQSVRGTMSRQINSGSELDVGMPQGVDL